MKKIALHYFSNNLLLVASKQRTVPMSLRLSPELIQRLDEAAERLRMKKHTLAQDAIEAAVEAIERNGYKLVLPIEFQVTHEAIERNSSSSASTSERNPAAHGAEEEQGRRRKAG